MSSEMRDLMAEAWRSLSRRSLTSVLAIVSVAMGVSAYLCVVSLSESLLSLQYADLEADPLASRPSISVYPWLDEGVPVPISQRAVATAVQRATGREVAWSATGSAGLKAGRVSKPRVTVRAVSGNTYRDGFGSESNLLRGRMISPEDDDQRRSVCTVPASLAERVLAPGQDPLGQSIRLNGVKFAIRGVTRRPLNESYEVITIPFSLAQAVFRGTSRWNVDVFSTEAGFESDLDRIDVALNRMDGKQHNWRNCCLGWYMHGNYAGFPKGLPLHMASSWVAARRRSAEWRAFRLRVGALAALCLVAGLLGLVSMLLANLGGRRYEIGLCRALGATAWRQAAEVLLGAAIVGALGGAVGVLLGVGMLRIFSDGFGMRLTVTPQWAYASVIVSTGTAVLAGLVPARAALGVSPGEALRSL
jgi:putative ABC transport system permease protein